MGFDAWDICQEIDDYNIISVCMHRFACVQRDRRRGKEYGLIGDI